MTVSGLVGKLKGPTLEKWSARKTKQGRGFIARTAERAVVYLAGSKAEAPKLLDAVSKRLKLTPQAERLA